MKSQDTWLLTDGSLFQYGRKLSEDVYQFKEFDRDEYGINLNESEDDSDFIERVFDDPEFWVEKTINLKDYSPKEVDDYISGYYDSIDEIKDSYGDEWQWIVAECIFEQTSGLY